MKKLLLLLSFLCFGSVLQAEQTKLKYNPFTGKLDYITALSTISIEAGAGVTITTTTTGVIITATGGGSDTQIQFNDGGSLGGDSNLTWDKVLNHLSSTGTFHLRSGSNSLDYDSTTVDPLYGLDWPLSIRNGSDFTGMGRWGFGTFSGAPYSSYFMLDDFNFLNSTVDGYFAVQGSTGGAGFVPRMKFILGSDRLEIGHTDPITFDGGTIISEVIVSSANKSGLYFDPTNTGPTLLLRDHNASWDGRLRFDSSVSGKVFDIAPDATNGELDISTTIHVSGLVISNNVEHFSVVLSTWYASSNWAGDTFPVWQAPRDYAITITSITATAFSASASSVTFNLEERAFNSLNSAGTDVFTVAEATANTTGCLYTTSGFTNPGIAAGAYLVWDTKGVILTVYYKRQ